MSDGIVPLCVHFAAMVFDAVAPDQALQLMADTLDVTTLALGRIDTATGAARVSVQNRKGVDVRAGWSNCEDGPRDSYVELTGDISAGSAETGLRDILIAQTSVGSITDTQRKMMADITPHLVALWAARQPAFERGFDKIRIELRGSILHPDNPCDLSRSEMRICELISQGHTTKDIVATLDLSMATVRTHLQHIYAKTGLDGMIGVLHHLQSHSVTERP